MSEEKEVKEVEDCVLGMRVGSNFIIDEEPIHGRPVDDDCDCGCGEKEGEGALAYNVNFGDDLRDNIRCEAAVCTSKEIDFISDLAAKCRLELFELILKADLDKEKIKEKVRALQEFLMASEHRTDQLTQRIEGLLSK